MPVISIRQEFAHDKLERAYDTANGTADLHDHIATLVGPIRHFSPKREQNRCRKASAEPTIPHRRGQLPTLIFVFAVVPCPLVARKYSNLFKGPCTTRG
jgi:hypothetical protein